ncbi:MAG: hypothetical protein ABI411_05455 [Tahibacter sp.]
MLEDREIQAGEIVASGGVGALPRLIRPQLRSALIIVLWTGFCVLGAIDSVFAMLFLGVYCIFSTVSDPNERAQFRRPLSKHALAIGAIALLAIAGLVTGLAWLGVSRESWTHVAPYFYFVLWIVVVGSGIAEMTWRARTRDMLRES